MIPSSSTKRIRVDWFRTVVELEKLGHNTYTIATAIDVPRRTVLGWRNYGAEPSHDTGERLIAFWCQTLQLPREALPLNVDDLLSAAKVK